MSSCNSFRTGCKLPTVCAAAMRVQLQRDPAISAGTPLARTINTPPVSPDAAKHNLQSHLPHPKGQERGYIKTVPKVAFPRPAMTRLHVCAGSADSDGGLIWDTPQQAAPFAWEDPLSSHSKVEAKLVKTRPSPLHENTRSIPRCDPVTLASDRTTTRLWGGIPASFSLSPLHCSLTSRKRKGEKQGGGAHIRSLWQPSKTNFSQPARCLVSGAAAVSRR
ncbi:uncharacterized protein LOC118471728 [Amphiprion ocellaris]|uniref:uncharacterized protein LOC118471728 n=1 Tax=Amphiprion ocellaris TaxID=80972 RepID=UPI001649FD3D|nr:uncharacterized protein LOC118471728 [Amphiprion ocellaris]